MTGKLSSHIKARHKSMSRMLGYTLTRDHADAWADFSKLAESNMTLHERAGLSVAALRSLSMPDAMQAAAAALDAAGMPLPAFLGGMTDARDWALYASPSELRAYALASYEHMSAKDQAAFFRHISVIEVAA